MPWTDAKDKALLVALIQVLAPEKISQSQWNATAEKMGKSYTASGLSQHFAKRLKNLDVSGDTDGATSQKPAKAGKTRTSGDGNGNGNGNGKSMSSAADSADVDGDDDGPDSSPVKIEDVDEDDVEVVDMNPTLKAVNGGLEEKDSLYF